MRSKIFRMGLGFAVIGLLGCQPKQGASTDPKSSSGFKARYATPQETFETWKHAAQTGDMALLVSTYAASARASMEQEYKNASPGDLKQSQDEAKKTKFSIEKVVYEGDKAFLRVIRSVRSSSEDEVLTMVREGQEWRIVP